MYSSLYPKIILLLILNGCFCIHSFSQGRIWFAELGANLISEQKVEYRGGSSTKAPAYGYFVNLNNGGKKLALGFEVDYAPVALKNIISTTYKKNSLGLWELYLSLRYYPMLPTIRFGTTAAMRFTAGGMIGGYDFYWRQNTSYGDAQLTWSPMRMSSVVFAGFCFSSFRNTSGLSVKLNYKPQAYSMNNFLFENFILKQPFSVSASVLIGPKIK